jgi:tetratricopeptide (TPR) repeat protein
LPLFLESGSADTHGVADVHNEISGSPSGNVVMARDIGEVHFHRSPAFRAMAGLPADEGFTGRAGELTVLSWILASDPVGSAVAMVAGSAGVGKTALVLRAARTALDSFGGGVLFVDLHGYDDVRRVDPQAALATLLRALGVPGEQLPPEQADRELLYRSTLAELADADQRVLVVADNAASPDQVMPLRPGTSVHRLVVTSRHTMPIPGARRVELDVLPTEDAIAVVATALTATDPEDTRVAVDPAAAQRLVELCGCLPLALRISAELLADQPTRPLADLVAILDTERNRLAELAYGDSVAVRLAFDASYRDLPADQARLFCLLPVNPGPFVDNEAAGALLGVATDVARRRLAGLRRAHLVQQAPGDAGYHLHDLLALYADERRADEVPAAEQAAATERLLAHYLSTTQAADAYVDAQLADEQASRFADRADALAWLDGQRQNVVAAVALAAEGGYDQVASDLPAGLTAYFDLRGYWIDWAEVSLLGAAAARRLGDPDAEAGHLNGLGLAYRTPGWAGRALEYFRQAGELYAGVGNQAGEAGAFMNIGTTELSLHDVAAGMEHIERAIGLYEADGDVYGEAIALVSIGGAYQSAGRLDDALAAYERAAPLFPAIGDRQGEGKVVGNIGVVLLGLERYEDAVAYLEHALELHRGTGDRYGELATLTDLGHGLAALGQDDEARSCHVAALALIEGLADVEAQARALVQLGMSESAYRRFAEAEEALSLAVPRCAGDRFREGQALLGLGIVYWSTDRLVEAEETQRRVITINEEIDNPYGVATAFSYLGLIHRDLADWDTAATYYDRSLAGFRDLNEPQAADNVTALIEDLTRRRSAT